MSMTVASTSNDSEQVGTMMTSAVVEVMPALAASSPSMMASKSDGSVDTTSIEAEKIENATTSAAPATSTDVVELMEDVKIIYADGVEEMSSSIPMPLTATKRTSMSTKHEVTSFVSAKASPSETSLPESSTMFIFSMAPALSTSMASTTEAETSATVTLAASTSAVSTTALRASPATMSATSTTTASTTASIRSNSENSTARKSKAPVEIVLSDSDDDIKIIGFVKKRKEEPPIQVVGIRAIIVDFQRRVSEFGTSKEFQFSRFKRFNDWETNKKDLFFKTVSPIR